MKELYFCKFDIKNGFLDPKKTLKQIFEHLALLKQQLYQILENASVKSPFSG